MHTSYVLQVCWHEDTLLNEDPCSLLFASVMSYKLMRWLANLQRNQGTKARCARKTHCFLPELLT